MTEHNQQQHVRTPVAEPTPLELPAARLREPSADDLPVEIVDPDELPLDDEDRELEEARVFEK